MIDKHHQLSPILLVIIFFTLWHFNIIQTQSSSLKINDIKLEENINQFQSKFPIYNVSGLLSVYSLDGINNNDGYCNRTYRIHMNKLFLDSCIESMRLLCGGSDIGRRKRNISPPLIYYPSSSSLFDSYAKQQKQEQQTQQDDDISSMMMSIESMDDSDEQQLSPPTTQQQQQQQQLQQQQHAEQVLDLIRQTSALASAKQLSAINQQQQQQQQQLQTSLESPLQLLRYRRNHHHHHHNHHAHHQNQRYTIIALESQLLMENCCQDGEKSDCQDTVLREKFQKICAPNLLTTTEMFRS